VIFDLYQETLVVLGGVLDGVLDGESCSSFWQLGSGSSVVIYNWMHCVYAFMEYPRWKWCMRYLIGNR
jgi:hypothetical protein